MKILRNLEVPTGNILVVEGYLGKLECLSLGDYGKDVNLNQYKKVTHTDLLPLDKKWVITISTQYGCSMGCQFCDVPKVGPGKNASFWDLLDQINVAMSLHPEVTSSERLNIHFARMGEPTWNWDVLEVTNYLAKYTQKYKLNFNLHPVVSTMMPKHNPRLEAFLDWWIALKNLVYHGNAGLQLSINSTNELEREKMFRRSALSLAEIGAIMDKMPAPLGRKYTLNFAVAEYEIDPVILLRYFDPAKFIIKLTPMHKTTTALQNNIKTVGDYTEPYPYEHYRDNLEAAGYEVLVFIASLEEDLGRITCGNAILSGAEPLIPYKEINVE